MSRRSGAIGAAAGVLATVLIGTGYLVVGGLPAPDASGQEVYARFLDDRSSLRLGAVLLLAGLALLVAFLTVLRDVIDPDRRTVASTTMLTAGLIAIAAAIFSAAAVGALAVGAENAAPESSRAVLDLSQAVTAASGLLFTVTLLAAAMAMARAGSGAPGRLGQVAVLAAPACLLWLAPLVTGADFLQPGSLLGFEMGLVLLLLWVVATAFWMRRRTES